MEIKCWLWLEVVADASSIMLEEAQMSVVAVKCRMAPIGECGIRKVFHPSMICVGMRVSMIGNQWQGVVAACEATWRRQEH